MRKTAKTKLSRDDLKAILEVYNKLDRIASNVHEILDMDLSQLREMQSKLSDLREIFKFRPVKGEDGNPKHYKPYVLPDDPTAWYYKEEAA
jgi:hypothetical protein